MSSIGNLTSPSCSNTNVMTLFPSLSRRKRSHGPRHYTPARLNEVSFKELLPLINEPLGLHHIRTKLYSIPLVSIHKLHDKCLDSTYFGQSSMNTNLTASFWILLIVECFNQLNQIFRTYLLTIFKK